MVSQQTVESEAVETDSDSEIPPRKKTRVWHPVAQVATIVTLPGSETCPGQDTQGADKSTHGTGIYM